MQILAVSSVFGWCEHDTTELDDRLGLCFLLQVMQYGKPVPGSQLPAELQERAAQLAKEYSRTMMREHHALTGSIQRKLNRQQAAIAAPPEPLQSEALEVTVFFGGGGFRVVGCASFLLDGD